MGRVVKFRIVVMLGIEKILFLKNLYLISETKFFKGGKVIAIPVLPFCIYCFPDLGSVMLVVVYLVVIL